MSSDKVNRKEKNQNIQVFVRLRPINNREKELKSMGVVEVSGPKDVIVKMSPLESKLTKKFSFDRAFGPTSKQVDVYQEVVSPLIEEVLSGYNCTVFAYGQTGTGKTHTMVGESSANGDVPWQNDPNAGIIPRALSQLFDELRITNTEFTVRVSYLELYNEELFDLLSSSEDNSKLRIYEDVTRKGSNIVNGLEEVTVYNKNEVYKIMAKGQEKRKIASTLMNAQSSRSHTVFTIVVHMKENSSDGEELMKIGKLNLVDLAGSENISKAGSDNPARRERARECVNINQSLLTLGRVITALVERHPHIPYRESKLTRLLQESLGGRTKTSIIATISPGHRDVEETLSTLDYAYRARCIQNKPEVNQRITKHAVLKEFSEEIDRLRSELRANREKNGVYLPDDMYADMTMKMEEQSKEIQDQILYIKAMKEEKDRIEGLFTEMADNLKRKEEQLHRTNTALNNAKEAIQVTKKDLSASRVECEEQKVLVSKRQATETILREQADKLLGVADTTTTQLYALHDTVDKKRVLEESNLQKVQGFGMQSQEHRKRMKEKLDTYIKEQSKQLRELQETLDFQYKKHVFDQYEGKQLLSSLLQKITEAMVESCCVKEQSISNYAQYSENKLSELSSASHAHKTTVEGKMQEILEIVHAVNQERDTLRNSAQQMVHFVQQWKDSFSMKMQNVNRMQEEWWQQYSSHMDSLAVEFEHQHSATLSDVQKTASQRQDAQQELFMNLKQVREALDELEKKMTTSAAHLSTEEKNNCTAMETRGITFSGALTSGVKNLETARESVMSVTGEMETSHDGFMKDIANINREHLTKMEHTASVEGRLTDSLLSLPSVYNKTWLEHNTAVCDSYREGIQRVTEIITTQQTHHTDVLNECHKEGADIITPTDSRISELKTMTEDNQESIQRIEKKLMDYTGNIEDIINVTDSIESRFLNEEYRTYSPTGKTPIRRDFSYPRDLAATSPHERILRRFRNMRNGAQSPKNYPIINLDHTMEEQSSVPIIDVSNQSCSDDNNISSPEHNSTTNTSAAQTPLSLSQPVTAAEKQEKSETKIFLEPTKLPPRATPRTSPNHIIKSTSDSDIYSHFNADSDTKENLNRTTTDSAKKEMKSRLRQPTQKKVLANRNC